MTAREQEILRLIAHGHSSKKIADELNISINTVNNHRASLYAKLRLHSATAAVSYYWVHRMSN